MTESYLIPGDAYVDLNDGIWAAQTFRPILPHTLFYVDVNMKCRDILFLPSVEIWFRIPNPATPANRLTTLQAWQRPPYNYNQVQRWRAIMYPIVLPANTTFSILIYRNAPHVYPGNAWQYQNITGTYTRGIRYLSINKGLTWTEHPNDDHIFSEFGDPPFPFTGTIPPFNNWLPANITVGDLDNGACVTLQTDVPCHLWLYDTAKPPLTHPITRTVRGATLPWYTRFCFVAYTGNEQLEEGDTLIHTFQLPNLTLGIQRYYSFKGTVNGQVSPSVAPIFQYTPPGQSLLYNPSFELWPVPSQPPSFWQKVVSGGGSVVVSQEKADVVHGKLAARITVAGYNTIGRLMQLQTIKKYRGQTIKFKIWGKGNVNPNTRMQITIVGPGSAQGSAGFTRPYEWQQLSVTITVPWDAEDVYCHLMCYNNDPSPIYTLWDALTIEV